MARTNKHLTVLVALLCAFSVSGQVVSQREVSYQTSTAKVCKLPCDVEIEALSALDLVYLQTKPALTTQTKFVINDNWLSIIRFHLQQPRYERDYEFQMGKSVTDKWGTRLYYHSGEEYYNLPNEEVNENFLLTAEQVEHYGVFNDLFNVSIAEIEASCAEANIPFYTWGQKVLVVYEKDGEDGFRVSVAQLNSQIKTH